MALDKPLNLNFLNAAPTQLPQENKEQQARADAHKKDLEATRKKLAEKEAQIKELQTENQQLKQENLATQERQQLLTAELEKAEAQAELIKELLLTDEQKGSLPT